MDSTLGMERLHQTDGSQRQSDAFLQNSAPQLVQFQAAAAQIKDEARGIEVAECPKHRDAHKSRFFFTRNDLEVDFGLVTYPLDQHVAIASFAGSAGRYGAIRGNAMAIHNSPEFSKCSGGITQRLAIEFSRGKGGMAKAHWSAKGFDNLPFVGGADSGDDQPERV